MTESDSILPVESSETTTEKDIGCQPQNQEGKDLLAEYEELFKDRFTEKDEKYTQNENTPLASPPCVENWYTRPKRTYDYTRDGSGHSGRGQGYRGRGQGHWQRNQGHHDQGSHRQGYDRGQGHRQDGWSNRDHGYRSHGQRDQGYHQRHSGNDQRDQRYDNRGSHYGNRQEHEDRGGYHGRGRVQYARQKPDGHQPYSRDQRY